ncbi:MAG: hypothetical protein COY58_06780 [Gammaproteobacteria bacterium CG_4_10_14_0_8_um_filter_38_16]|nr:MAG: hypothetical protein COY58_06780 [Gammaproteobacteria bacterium CG_4_10_14_0_8_um_filter_38_16]PJA03739.1 MAG: hypothetical protein COX72_03755 [Gammaproteobacteria bacterium CG_4_10_14_0_2_um_filter_38_22]PJB10995.1 MAG: hypothetical protein CO120_01950 [Gammaproteobacteria bacterium CG_4_9_14_3_um_filter_38_9]
MRRSKVLHVWETDGTILLAGAPYGCLASTPPKLRGEGDLEIIRDSNDELKDIVIPKLSSLVFYLYDYQNLSAIVNAPKKLEESFPAFVLCYTYLYSSYYNDL